MSKLISMTEKVLQLSKDLGIGGDTFQDFYLKSTYYANFLSQPLTLGMFMPCDENNVPFEEDGTDGNGYVLDKIMFDQYQQAKDKVLFEGFFICHGADAKPTDVKSITNGTVHVYWFNNAQQWYLSKGLNTIENIVKYNITLTKK
jgi:hypothetical protein